MSVNSITPSDLKTILHSKRANIYYLEKCRIQVNGGRVEYVTQEGKESFYWNIPIANTTAVMLGMGTSVTQMAMREFARAGVMVGFCGTDGTPLYSANEVDIDVSWLCPQSEYRPTGYLQNWVSFWFNEEKRLQAAKQFQFIRLLQIEKQWTGLRMQRETAFQPDKDALNILLERARQGMEKAQDHTSLMLQEAQLTKSLYKLTSQTTGYGSFTRAKRGGGVDTANHFLDQGNYLAYGLAAVAAWVTGIPHGLAVMHGKTRRGGLVFDIADLIKDALVMPQAFMAAMEGEDHLQFRQRCINAFQQADALVLDLTSRVSACEAIFVRFAEADGRTLEMNTMLFPGQKVRAVFRLKWLDGSLLFPPLNPGTLKTCVSGQGLEKARVVSLTIGFLPGRQERRRFDLADVFLTDEAIDFPKAAETTVDALGQWKQKDWPRKLPSAAALYFHAQSP